MEFEYQSKAKLDLILAAEHLIGQSGINDISLREVAKAAGNKNVTAAQYHFETKENLVKAVLFFRRAEMESVRLRIFAEGGISLQDMDLRKLMLLLITPPFEQRNSEGIRSFSRFYRAAMPVINSQDIWSSLQTSAPFTYKVMDVIRCALPPIPDSEWTMRAKGLSHLQFNMIADYDLELVAPAMTDEIFVEQLVQMSVGLLSMSGQLAWR